MKQYGISITHKFKTERAVFKVGVLYTKQQIINEVFTHGWATPNLTEEENIKRIENAIRHNCRKDVRRIESLNGGENYRFL